MSHPLGFGAERSSSCAFCRREVPPEDLHTLVVPYFAGQRFEICAPCAEGYTSSGCQPIPFEPGLSQPRFFLWPEPSAADEAAAQDAPDLCAAIRCYREVRVRLAQIAAAEPAIQDFQEPKTPLDRLWLRRADLAQLAYRRDPALKTLLDAAWEGFDDALPSQATLLRTEAQGRGMVLFALLALELGAQAPRLFPRRNDPGAWLNELQDQGLDRPALRDPRIPLMRALLYWQDGNLDGVDKQLQEGIRWVGPEAVRGPWAQTAFALHAQRAQRARDAGHWALARDAWKACCRIRPDDHAGFLQLADAYLRCARPAIAREILAARLGPARVTTAGLHAEVSHDLEEIRPGLELATRGRDPTLDALVLYAACLQSLGQPDAAWLALAGPTLLDSCLDDDVKMDPRILELAAMCANDRGRNQDARRLLGVAEALLARDSAAATPRIVSVRERRLTLLHDDLQEQLAAIEERTREAARRLAEAHDEDPDASARAELADQIRGEPGGLEPGLVDVHERLQQDAPILKHAFDADLRQALSWFLDRELASNHEALALPPDFLDTEGLRFDRLRMEGIMAVRALARRQLPSALQFNQELRRARGRGLPIALLLAYLHLIARGGAALRSWAFDELAPFRSERVS